MEQKDQCGLPGADYNCRDPMAFIFADLNRFPQFMFAYIYPYSFVVRAFGNAMVLPVIFFQLTVALLYVFSFSASARKSRVINIVACIFAVFWFVSISLTIFIAHIH